MNTSLTLSALALAAALAFPALSSSAPVEPPAPAAAAAPVAECSIDTVHSAILFRTKHIGTSHAWGRFNNFTGRFTLDEKEPAKSSIAIEVEAESIDTANADRDKHLRGPDFFNAKQFPKLSFHSTKVSAAGKDKYNVEGELEMLGVKKPVHFSAEKIGAGEFPMDKSYRVGLDAQLTIQRSDFGLKYGVDNGVLGDEVALWISLEGVVAK